MKKIAIVTDSNSGITPELAKQMNVFVIPMPIIVDGKEYFEEVNITDTEFFEYLEGGSDCHTSQPSVGSVTGLWNELLEEYDEIVHIPMSSGLSSSYQTACLIAEDYDGKVQVVNNQQISITLYHDVVMALELAKRGKDAREIKDFLEERKHMSTIYLTVPTLEYLKKGGRVTPSAAALGGLLKIKPVLTIQGDKLDSFAKVRTVAKGEKVMYEAMKKDIETRIDPEGKGRNCTIYVAYSKDTALRDEYIQYLQEYYPDHKILAFPLSVSIACHTGPNIIACAASLNLD